MKLLNKPTGHRRGQSAASLSRRNLFERFARIRKVLFGLLKRKKIRRSRFRNDLQQLAAILASVQLRMPGNIYP
ncbi:hypothetical protein [Burkholderia anthina]|uniref:hypothetical protein n=1 Tax=Burkholderia anthina TaxID=179879 RepID=UPI001589D578|nr:hypothetical protein [Burkholderia anthina]